MDLAVVTSNTEFSGVTIFPGNGNGSFGAPLLTQTINQPTALAVRDLNGDTKRDLVVTTAAGVAAVLLGNGDGTFAPRVDYAVGTNPKWVVVGDFNNDTKLDLAVANDGGTGVSILLGNGDGTFGTATEVVSGGVSDSLEPGDFNRDGKLDLAVVHDGTGGPAVSVLFGKGDGTFNAPKSYSTQVGPGSVGVGDFNRDGKLDLAVPTFFGSTVTIFRNTAGGSFAHGPELAADSLPTGSCVADVTGDGKLDIVVVNTFGRNLFLFPGKGDGTFAAPKKYWVGPGRAGCRAPTSTGTASSTWPWSTARARSRCWKRGPRPRTSGCPLSQPPQRPGPPSRWSSQPWTPGGTWRRTSRGRYGSRARTRRLSCLSHTSSPRPMAA